MHVRETRALRVPATFNKAITVPMPVPRQSPLRGRGVRQNDQAGVRSGSIAGVWESLRERWPCCLTFPR